MMNDFFSHIAENKRILSNMSAYCRPNAACYSFNNAGCNNNETDKTTWAVNVNLKQYPTKSEDLNVKFENGHLICSGKSETQSEHNGFKVEFLINSKSLLSYSF